MSVSVIIPVFNALPFLEKAVTSALIQSEVLEVLLIDDASTDGSADLCHNLSKNNSRVKYHFHEGHINKGPGESRNLGLKLSKGKYIAFLDADDFYLPNRFEKAMKLLEEQADLDGVHEVIGVEYYSEDAKEKHRNRMVRLKKNIQSRRVPLDFTGVEEFIPHDQLCFYLLTVDKGWIHLDGLTVRRTSISDIDWFNTNFIGQDGEFILRLACKKKLTNTNYFEPVAIRGVHDENRIIKKDSPKKNKIDISYNYWLSWFLNNKGSPKIIRYLLLRVTDCGNNKALKLIRIFLMLFQKPSLVKSLF